MLFRSNNTDFVANYCHLIQKAVRELRSCYTSLIDRIEEQIIERLELQEYEYIDYITEIRQRLINPTQNIINKENIENKNLLEKFTDLSDRDLAILTKLSFRDYDNNASISFSENNIVN